MKVLFLTRSVTLPQGWERYTRGLIAGLADEGVEPIILACQPEPDPAFPFRPEAVRLNWADWGPRLYLTLPLNYLKIRPWLKGVELIHALVEPLGPLGWAASVLTGLPLVVSGVGTYAVEPFITGRGAWLARRTFGRAAAVPCISDFTRRRLLEVCPTAKATAIPLGYTPPEAQPAADADLSGLPELSRPFFLSVGPLKTRKGHALVLEAFSRLAKEEPGLDWVIAGHNFDPRHPREFARRVKEAGLEERVHILGRVEEPVLQRLYADCLFYVLTPTADQHSFEGFGLTYLEAGWHHKPSIATRDSGAEESIEDGVEGFMIGQGDAEALAQAMDSLRRDEALRQKMGQAARVRAEAMTWAATAQKTAALYHQILGEGR